MRFKFVSAVHLLLIKDEHILLSRRFNTGYEDGNYSVVAGHLEGGEEVKAAMMREAKEEIGVEVDPQVVGVMHRLSQEERIDFFLVAHDWQGEITNREPALCDDIRWFPIHQLPDNTIPYVRRAVENFLNHVWFDSFGF